MGRRWSGPNSPNTPPVSNVERFKRLLGSQAKASDLKSRTIHSGVFAVGAEGVEFVFRLGSIIVLARLLVPEQFGLIAMVTAITGVAERFKDLGLSVATVQRKEITYDQVSTLFWVNAAMGIGLTLLIAALAFPIARFYGDPRLVAISVALGSTFFFSGITIQHQALQRRLMRFGQLAVVQIGASAASVAIAVAIAFMDYGYWALVAREVSRSILVMLGTWICVPWIPSRPSRQADVKSMLIFGGDVTAFSLIWSFVTFNLDQILIGKLFGATPLGLYRQGINLVLAPISQVSFPVSTVAEATLSRLQDAAERYRRYYVRFLGAIASVTIPLAVFLALFAEEVVQVALGAKWVAATDYLRILAIAAIVRPAAFTAGFVMVTCGRSRRYLWWGIFQSVGLAVFLTIGTQWGPEGVAYAHVASTYLVLVPLLYWGFAGTPITVGDFASTVQKPIVATVAMAGVLYVVKRAAIVDGAMHLLALGSALALLAYFGAWLVLPGGREALWQAFTYVYILVREQEPGADGSSNRIP
jgi:O-antigen/teichoic acid export membrane protein